MQDVAASGNNVYVTWCDDKTGDMEIYVRKSADGGQTFGNTTMLKSVGTLPSSIKYIPYEQQDAELIQIDTNVALSGNNIYAGGKIRLETGKSCLQEVLMEGRHLKIQLI